MGIMTMLVVEEGSIVAEGAVERRLQQGNEYFYSNVYYLADGKMIYGSSTKMKRGADG